MINDRVDITQIEMNLCCNSIPNMVHVLRFSKIDLSEITNTGKKTVINAYVLRFHWLFLKSEKNLKLNKVISNLKVIIFKNSI